MTAYGYDEDGEREHDCCPRCGRGSCLGSGSLGWDGCEDPVWISVSASVCMDCPPPSANDDSTVQP